MKVLRSIVAAALLATALGPALASPANDPGIYLVAAVGGNQYDYDCYWASDCRYARSSAGKIGAGYRFGVVGVEAWYIDFGRANIVPWPDRLQLRSAGANAVWYLNFAPSISGLLRAGAASVTQQRSLDGRHTVTSATLGLGLVADLSSLAAMEVAWDVAGSEGNNTGSSVASMLTVGLRVRF